MTDPKDHNQPTGPHGPDCDCPAGIPAVATVVEVVGGPNDGAHAAVISSEDTLLMLVLDRAGNLNLRTELDPLQLADVTRQIAKSASLRAAEYLRAQS